MLSWRSSRYITDIIISYVILHRSFPSSGIFNNNTTWLVLAGADEEDTVLSTRERATNVYVSMYMHAYVYAMG